MIERPTSVLKELVENSLDAGSSQVDIELREGGFKYIRVTDNGWGMSPQDLTLAVQRHATSKIASAQDLWQIRTFGFRGEALPSIAAVSRLEISSRTFASDTAWRLKLEGGKDLKLEPTGTPPGTTVTVRELFFNTPARRKFQKSPAAEFAHSLDLVSRLALANPQVAFRLRSGGRLFLHTSGNNSLLEAIASVYGVSLAREMLKLEGPGISGFISPLGITRNNRQRQTYVVNRRYVNSQLLADALDEAYRGKIPPQRFPVAVLHLEVEPSKVDVNVHPAKLEVRFREAEFIRNLVFQSVNQVLQEKRSVAAQTPQRWPLQLDQREHTATSSSRLFNGDGSRRTDSESMVYRADLKVQETAASYPVPKEARAAEPPLNSFQDLLLLGQLSRTYLVAEGNGDLYLIDQHAAHERILFEQIMESLRERPGSSQSLLLPEVVDLAPDERERFLQSILLFRDLGFVVEDFGGKSLLLRGVPAVLKSAVRETFLDLVDALNETASKTPTEKIAEILSERLACRQAIKAGQVLERGEMEALLLGLEKTSNPLSCPHGRPTVICLQHSDIQRRFYR